MTFQDKNLLRKRFYAFFIDLFLVGVASKAILLMYFVFIESTLRFIPLNYKSSLYNNLRVIHFPVILMSFFGLYFLSLYIAHGRSPGKALMKIRVISQTHPTHGLSIGEAFMRAFGGVLCYMSMCTLFVFSLFNKEGRGLPEWFSGTKIVTDEEYEAILHPKEEIQNTFSLFENDAA